LPNSTAKDAIRDGIAAHGALFQRLVMTALRAENPRPQTREMSHFGETTPL